MGVPKFFRWISERYPCISQVVVEHQIPEFDNFYLDMNGIIHNCSHPNDGDPMDVIPEEKIFSDVFTRIEHIYRIIKPKKVLFLAIDGVAPRAKMNQQRSRRFRSAREAERAKQQAVAKGDASANAEMFDSNCITPGTEFMARLSEYLQFRIASKMANDRSWRHIRVVFSGHEVPGEGEHKITAFIRGERARPDYDPNTRHCMYGLDADLIFLGLVSHEPHFSLLREEVQFGRPSKKKVVAAAEQQTYNLLHLSLFREYLSYEFASLATPGVLSFPFDLERVIDDYVLMGFLVGNDFIPHVPHFHIDSGALAFLIESYKTIMPTLDGYLNDCGVIDLSRLEKFLAGTGKYDFELFEERTMDLRYLEGNHRGKGGRHGGPRGKRPPRGRGKQGDLSPDPRAASPRLQETPQTPAGAQGVDAAARPSSGDKLEVPPGIGLFGPEDGLDAAVAGADSNSEWEDEPDEDEDDVVPPPSHVDALAKTIPPEKESTLRGEFEATKREYYREKFGVEPTPEFVAGLCRDYVVGLQWVLLYYHAGVQSWGWFFPHHYAPYVSDIHTFAGQPIVLDLGKPFRPFEQLLGVLPAASARLLPEAYRSLMVAKDSEIVDFYPKTFKTDLNGKKNDWEAVVLIPFIDEHRLLAAMEGPSAALTEAEKKRNAFGADVVYSHDPTCKANIPSPSSSIPRLVDAPVRVEPLPDHGAYPRKKGLLPGVKTDVFFPGFPTLKHIEHDVALRIAGVCVFQQPSRGENMILTVKEKDVQSQTAVQIAGQYLGRTVHVGWPHLKEALVTCVEDETDRMRHVPALRDRKPSTIRTVQSKQTLSMYRQAIEDETDRHMSRRGIDIGKTRVLLRVRLAEGKRTFFQNNMVEQQTQWADEELAVPYQVAVRDLVVDTAAVQTVEDHFPVGSKAFFLGFPSYGCTATVIRHNASTGKLDIKLEVTNDDRAVATAQMISQQASERYAPPYAVARQCGLSVRNVNRITSAMIVDRANNQRANLGLNFRFHKKDQQALGFARRREDNTWEYSNAAIAAIRDYMRRFPEFFVKLENFGDGDGFLSENDLFPLASGETIQDVVAYLKTLECSNAALVPCGSKVMSPEAVRALEMFLLQNSGKLSQGVREAVLKDVVPFLLHRGYETNDSLPDRTVTFELGDRVVCVDGDNGVAVGTRGFVVAIYGSPVEKIEVLWDVAWPGGNMLAGKCTTTRGGTALATGVINVSHGMRKNNAVPPANSNAGAAAQSMPRGRGPVPYMGAGSTTTSTSLGPRPAMQQSHSANAGRPQQQPQGQRPQGAQGPSPSFAGRGAPLTHSASASAAGPSKGTTHTQPQGLRPLAFIPPQAALSVLKRSPSSPSPQTAAQGAQQGSSAQTLAPSQSQPQLQQQAKPASPKIKSPAPQRAANSPKGQKAQPRQGPAPSGPPTSAQSAPSPADPLSESGQLMFFDPSRAVRSPSIAGSVADGVSPLPSPAPSIASSRGEPPSPLPLAGGAARSLTQPPTAQPQQQPQQQAAVSAFPVAPVPAAVAATSVPPGAVAVPVQSLFAMAAQSPPMASPLPYGMVGVGGVPMPVPYGYPGGPGPFPYPPYPYGVPAVAPPAMQPPPTGINLNDPSFPPPPSVVPSSAPFTGQPLSMGASPRPPRATGLDESIALLQQQSASLGAASPSAPQRGGGNKGQQKGAQPQQKASGAQKTMQRQKSTPLSETFGATANAPVVAPATPKDGASFSWQQLQLMGASSAPTSPAGPATDKGSQPQKRKQKAPQQPVPQPSSAPESFKGGAEQVANAANASAVPKKNKPKQRANKGASGDGTQASNGGVEGAPAADDAQGGLTWQQKQLLNM